MPTDPWPPHLLKDIARRRVVLVIGSGVSRHALGADGEARPPVWKSFLEDASKKIERDESTDHIFQAIDDGDLLHACEWMKKRFDENWTTHLRSVFVDPHYTPSELHKLLALLDIRVVFSLNFDDIYENKAREINEASQFVKNYYDTDVCEFLRGDARYIVKVHGNISSPAHLIFTQEDYSSARVRHALFYSAFDAALMTHTFFFVGCGYRDPDVNLLLENQAFSVVPGSISPHYFLTSEGLPGDLKNSLRRNRNLKVLTYDPVDENHSGLVSAIEDLLRKVTDERAVLLENGNW